MRIQHNIMAMNAYRNYTNNTSALSKNLEKLSSGYKINRAGDDAAGLAISEKMRAQITGLETAQKNAKDGISLVQTAEGALTEVHDMLNRMVELANQSANGTYDNETDRLQLQKEVKQLQDEINRIADSANFNGIKLLDGSLDAEGTSAISPDSAISNILTQAYAAKGAAGAFEAGYITNRPGVSTTQTNASFTVSFDDIALDAIATGNNEISVTIGGTTVNLKFADATAKTGAEIAAQLAQSGFAAGNATEFVTGGGKPAVDTSDTADWKVEGDKWANDGTADADNKYIEIDGNYYSMTATGNSVTFNQVNYTGESGEVINPDFAVSVKKGAAGGDVSGTTNWHVQNPVTGTGIGSSHQAQAEVAIDFSKLKDGDVLTIGDKNFVFKVGAGSATATGTGETLIDLSTIFASEADLADEAKQKAAMDKLVDEMGKSNSAAWSFGNGGVTDGKGTVTLQSQSGYVDGTADIGGNTNNDKVSMDTEANVLKQIYGTSKEQNASVSFELDVTKLKEGDTVTINGYTFEFTDGTHTSDKANIAVDLSALGFSGGLLASQTGDVMAELKTAVEGAFGTGASAKYDVSVDGNKLTLTSKDDTNTTAVFENRTAATVELPQTAYAGEALTLQIGDTSDDYNQLRVSIQDMHADSLGISAIDIGNQAGAQAAVDVIKDAINMVSDVRGTLGATQNRLDHTINNLSVMTENIQDAESTIRDTDVADEMMAYTKNNILIQSAQAMLAQANQVPQGVLQLLQ